MFWNNVCQLCNSNNISPNRLCSELGFSVATATKWKQGAVPRETTLLKIADYFGVSTAYLLGEGEKEKSPSGRLGVKVPVYGSVAAGIPIEAITDIEDYEEISEDMAKKGEYIALKIKGNSMYPKLMNGDVVIIRLQSDVDNGDIAIVMVNGGEATCKRIEKSEKGVTLVPIITDEYSAKTYTNAEIEELPVRIIGKVVELRRTI